VNILARKARPLTRLADLGIARVSLAGDLFRLGLAAVQERLAASPPRSLDPVADSPRCYQRARTSPIRKSNSVVSRYPNPAW
jgi:hypothetical protein